ncbi:hypothetical protein VEE20_05170 [Escherichia coli]|nr:hypothetical protein VEE20_05170 [Escherichia coli]
MKRIITGCLLLNFAMAAQAECNISSSIQNIDYGKRSAAMRQVDRGKTTQLADRTITLVMQCDQDAHIRVQLNTANISNNGFGFGPNGSLNLIASDAFSGSGFAPIFPDTCYHLTHYWLAAVDIPVASDNPVHYADAIRYNARTPLQGSLLPLTRLVWA